MTGTGVLWIVGTPIGNLGDLSPRAIEVLGSVDLVACEDTRRTGRLLARFSVKRPMMSFFEGNERQRVPKIVDRMLGGAAVALVSDGGMPSVSDPGYRLVTACIDADVDVRVVPGPSAALAALVLSGLPTDRFAFEGFLPRKMGDRARRLESLRDDPRTLVLFESPHRVADLLRDLLGTLGDRRVAVARELTKLHEEVVRGRLADVRSRLGDAPMKGEVAVVVAGARADDDPDATERDATEAAVEARALVAGGMRPRDAARAVAASSGVAANDVYRAMLAGD